MIPNDILQELVPPEDPVGGFTFDEDILRTDPHGPARRIGLWSAFLRFQIYRAMSEDRYLSALIASSGFIATGVFRAPYDLPGDRLPVYPTHRGFLFGAMLMRGPFGGETESSIVRSVPMNAGAYQAPIIQTFAQFNKHAGSPDGCIAATHFDDQGRTGGITARHVVESCRCGQRVPVICPECGASTSLSRLAPGLLDAAIVSFACGCRCATQSGQARRAIEGETVEAHYGLSGKISCTVMSALQTPAQIRSAAMPEHFLIDVHGYPGDSGSLVSSSSTYGVARDLVGIYLGQTDCEDQQRNRFTYGYALDLRQAAHISGVNIGTMQGVFND
jgi:hypothetical protein